MKILLPVKKSPKMALFVTSLVITIFLQSIKAETPTDPPGSYYTSWLANTYMDKNGNKNVTESLDDICLSPNGHVFSAGYAESGGGGASYNAADGSFRFRYSGTNSGFGDPLKCVAADDNSVYYGSGVGILKAGHNGSTGVYTPYMAGKSVAGLYFKNGKLYVSNFSDGKIHVLNTATMTEDLSFSCANPTRLTVDNAGNIWVVIWDAASTQKPSEGPVWYGIKVKSFSSTGTPGPEITDFEKPLGIAVNKEGQLLLGGLNEHCQIWKYDISGTPIKMGTFGTYKGIFGGAKSGAFTDSAKLHWIKSIVVDTDDNIYAGCVYGTFWSGSVEKFNPSGGLLWRVFAGTSLDCGGLDPDHPTEVYSKFHHYSLDYSKKTPGTEWSLKGFTVNRFKYSTDYRVDQNTDVGSRSLGAGAYRIGGKLYLVRSNQEGYRWELYRQDTTSDGEVLVPSVVMGAGGDHNNHFFNANTKTWYDKPKKDDKYNQYWCIAKNGDLFTLGDGPDLIIQYKYGGLDENNNPIWDASNATSVPSPMTYDVRRIYYDSDEDVMYLTGDEPEGQWGTFQKIRRFDNWSTGNRTPSFVAELPFEDHEYIPDLQYGGGDPTAFSVAGDYMFILYGYGHIRILNKTDGSLVGTLKQNVNGVTGGAGQVDASYGMTVTRRITGEYIILFESATWANIMIQRWCPDGTCSEIITPVEEVTVSPDTLNIYGTGTGSLSTAITPSNASNKDLEWSSSDPGIAIVTGAPNGKCIVSGISLGKCIIKATTKDGMKTDSATVFVKSQAVSGISVTPDSTTMGIGRTRQLSAMVLPTTATIKNVNWISTDTTVAKVDAYGLVTAKAFGSVAIKGISVDGAFRDSCIVTVGVTGDGLNGEYYNSVNFTGTIALSRVDATVDFAYGDNSYADGQPTDHFSIRWSGQVEPLYSETYTFETSCDDGSRLWVNGKQLVNNWIVQGETPKSGTIVLSKGIKYNIMMEYYENDGGASAHLSWSSPSQVKEIIPQDQLYSTYTPIPVTGINVNPDVFSSKIGDHVTLTAIIVPENADNQAVNWSSENPSVATVDTKGKVTLIAEGSTKITATTADGNFTAYCSVVVKPNGISDKKLTDILLFPNPFKDELTVSKEVDEFSVYSIDGVILISEKLTNHINTTGLPKGVYLVKIQKNGYSTVNKCIKN